MPQDELWGIIGSFQRKNEECMVKAEHHQSATFGILKFIMITSRVSEDTKLDNETN